MRLSPRLVFVAQMLISVGLVGVALIMGNWLALQPCYLCNFQRFLYFIIAAFALGGVVVSKWRKLWAALAGFTALGGLLTALEQSWMQYSPETVTECGFGDPTLLERTVDWLGTQWPSLFMVTGFCTEKDWVFLGLSLANWSGVCFLFLLLLSLWQFFRRWQA